MHNAIHLNAIRAVILHENESFVTQIHSLDPENMWIEKYPCVEHSTFHHKSEDDNNE